MRIIKRSQIDLFAESYPESLAPLDYWFKFTKRSNWNSFADVRNTFGQTDMAKVSSGNTVAIFDIGGNKFRLIARISYEKKKVYVLRILTHKQYDKETWKAEL